MKLNLKTQVILLSALLLFFKDSIAEESRNDAAVIISKVIDNYEKYHSMSYELVLSDKSLFYKDTILINAKCLFVRNPEDSLYKSSFRYWAKTDIDLEILYDKYHAYKINHEDSSIIHYDSANIKRAIVMNRLKDNYFINPNSLLSSIKDSSNVIIVSKDTIRNREFVKIGIYYPDENDIKDINKIFWVNAGNFNIEKFSFQVKFQGNYQYHEWNLKKIEFDNTDSDFFKRRIDELKKIYSYENYLPPVKTARKELLAKGTIAPAFKGTVFQTNKEINLEDYRGKLVLIDFWYLSCPPCLRAIPHLVELYNKYKEQGLVILGLNSFDVRLKREEQLQKCIDHNKIEYPVVSIPKEIEGLYNIVGHPVIYLINQNGEIVYSVEGFGEPVVEPLNQKVIEELVKMNTP